MSDSQEEPWTNNPNAPKIPHDLYLREKSYFAGVLVAALLYGACKALPHNIHPSVLTLFGLF